MWSEISLSVGDMKNESNGGEKNLMGKDSLKKKNTNIFAWELPHCMAVDSEEGKGAWSEFCKQHSVVILLNFCSSLFTLDKTHSLNPDV